MELNNKSADALLSAGSYELKEVTVPILVNKSTNAVKFPTTDGSNIITDKYICLTTMYGVPVCRTRDHVNTNPLATILNEAKQIFIKQGKKELENYIIKKNIPSDWAKLIFELIGIVVK